MEPTEADIATFDDPALKAAVARVWGAQRCPDAVRSRVMATVATVGRQDGEARETVAPRNDPRGAGRTLVVIPPTARPGFWQQPWLRYGLAAAATVLLGFGIASRLDNRDRYNLGGTEVTFASTVPQDIARGMVDSHDRCSKYSDHNAFPGVSDFAVVRRQLENRLGFPVLAGDVEEALGRNGWQFKGAAVCKVGAVDAAHLVFVRNGQAISMFSLPPASCRHNGRTAHECEDANPDHPAAVFVWSDGVHCVVGSSTDRTLSVDQVRAVLEHLRPNLPRTAPR